MARNLPSSLQASEMNSGVRNITLSPLPLKKRKPETTNANNLSQQQTSSLLDKNEKGAYILNVYWTPKLIRKYPNRPNI